MLLSISTAQSSNITNSGLNSSLNLSITSPFNLTTPYPINATGQQCSTYLGYVYCIGGFTSSGNINETYYATVNSTGIGQWGNTTPFPIATTPSCTSANGYIYCMALSRTNTTVSYYAPLSSSGIGGWTSTSGIPTPLSGESCISQGSTIYCIGGINPTLNYDIISTNSVYYAPLSDSGIGIWNMTTPYPYTITGEACLDLNPRIYCTGGLYAYSIVNRSFYATASSSGIGQWLPAPPFSVQINNQQCDVYNNYSYCISGSTPSSIAENYTFYAQISGNMTGNWIQGRPLPTNQTFSSCPAYNGYVYCMGAYSGGFTNETYFAFLPELQVNYTQASTTVTTSIGITTIPAPNTSIGLSTTTVSGVQSPSTYNSTVIQLVIVAAIILAIYIGFRIRSRMAGTIGKK